MSERKFYATRWVAAALALAGLGGLLYQVAKDNLPKGEVRKVEGYVPWSDETVKIAETIPVQEGGRVKPFSTQAGFTMLGFHGARSMKIETADGKTHKILPTEWMLDALFRPALAVKQPTFRVDNSEILTNAGITVRGKRDRYTYEDLEPGIEKLVEQAKSYEDNKGKQAKTDPIHQQTIDLAYQIRSYEALLGYFSFARTQIVLQGTGGGTKPDTRTNLSTVMQMAPHIQQELGRAQAAGEQINPKIRNLLEQVLDAANFSKFGLFVLPPSDKADKTWRTAGNAIMEVMTHESEDPETAIKDIGEMETLVRSVGKDDDLDFRKELQKFHDKTMARAEARGEYKRVEMEAAYYRYNYFLNAVVLFLIATVTGLAMWAVGRNRAGKILEWTTSALTWGGVMFCIVAIVKRCIIMGRPPVGNLYDTIIFIAATAVIFCFIVEAMTKRRFALGIAPILAATLIVLARRYELSDAKDHMDPLIAVLDSNFWLMIHVITITLGYSAGLLAAVISWVYILLRGLRLDGGDKDLRRSITRAVYGMLCVTLFLSLVGTVLGGIWANYSWGRFWGWDPKENGALMIVLWSLAILHARMGGYIKEWGLHLSSLFTSAVVVFSWWHVNFLGVGLHNYGFTAGKDTIWLFYGVILVFILLGVVAMAMERMEKIQKQVNAEGLRQDKIAG